MSAGIVAISFFVNEGGLYRYVGSSFHYVGSFSCYVGGFSSGKGSSGSFPFLPLFPYRKKSSAFILRRISRLLQDYIVRSDRFSVGCTRKVSANNSSSMVSKRIPQPFSYLSSFLILLRADSSRTAPNAEDLQNAANPFVSDARIPMGVHMDLLNKRSSHTGPRMNSSNRNFLTPIRSRVFSGLTMPSWSMNITTPTEESLAKLTSHPFSKDPTGEITGQNIKNLNFGLLMDSLVYSRKGSKHWTAAVLVLHR